MTTSHTVLNADAQCRQVCARVLSASPRRPYRNGTAQQDFLVGVASTSARVCRDKDSCVAMCTVYMRRINVLLTLLAWLPGVIHAFYVILKY
ncbi:hypothetical protein QJQ45_027656 [Haematococcus lacustris]|nr:hypothetical protein QJQ45_015603 [Haematococcus lacustris]KAJ9510709.1 hypothetical protein QJQ45_027656 [Haematococcus lacustris]